ncbi:MAG: hypothetical protein EA398_04250 [Deltaproteobacteria bacterium]|nr:MAG: hypothetical protein EA398_04250 [Deltaproteobacteria bacterium]
MTYQDVIAALESAIAANPSEFLAFDAVIGLEIEDENQGFVYYKGDLDSKAKAPYITSASSMPTDAALTVQVKDKDFVDLYENKLLPIAAISSGKLKIVSTCS